MFALFFLGRLLEPAIGTPRFVALYFASLFAGSFGALAAHRPGELTVGASGAIFGALRRDLRDRPRPRPRRRRRRELGFLLLINLALHLRRPPTSASAATSAASPAACACALVIVAGERGMLGPRRLAVELVGMTAVAVVSIVGAIAVA